MAHNPTLLRVANACHPEMDDRQRHRILAAVAEDTRNAAWSDWLRRAPGKKTNTTVAMRMLRDLEQPWSDGDGATEGWQRRRVRSGRRPRAAVRALILLLLMLVGAILVILLA